MSRTSAMPTLALPRSRKWLLAASGLMLALAGCADPPAAPQIPAAPPTAGQARLWFYRDWQPSESLDLANVGVNGSLFASVANGSVLYRDVPPGLYHIAPMSFVPNSNQDTNVTLVPGQQVYVKIVSLESWGSDNTGSKNILRDAFWAWVMPPAVAQSEIARDRNGI